jgi:glucosamine--fructose-6-phosphate aminotransferase (isomerizing)
MCGIVAYLSENKEAINYLINGLIILQNRGYDSSGVCTIDKNSNLITTKYASTDKESSIHMLQNNTFPHLSHNIGIAHTRWATHGPKTDYNAHPHIDCKNRVALVHNGIIENYKELKEMLQQNNFTFSSDTDSEVIANLISFYLDKYEILDAINHTISQLRGTWGLAILYNKDPDHLYISRNGSPLLVAYDNNFIMVASESSAFSQYTNKYIVLRDNEIIKLGINSTNQLIDYDYKIIENVEDICLTPHPYQHWMLKEIFEQSDTALRATNMGGRILNDYNVKLGGLSNHQDDLLKIENLLIVACGTSYHAGLLGAKYFRMLKCFNTVNVIDAAELIESDIPENGAGMIVLSQSGETRDVYTVMQMAKKNNVRVIGIVNVVGSLISRESDCGVYLNAGREVAVASTKAFTSQVIVLALVAIWFSQNRGDKMKSRQKLIIDDIRNLSFKFTDIIKNISFIIKDELLQKLKNKQHMFILGRGFAYPIACEGSLKIKEISYIHAEGYSGGALKHGPFALIEKGTPIIMIILEDEYKDKMFSAAEEVRARGAHTIAITNFKMNNSVFDDVISIPDCGVMSSLLAILPLQYLSYKLALELGYNPDYPRNLAKAVVVD